jgi:hypothetical protein
LEKSVLKNAVIVKKIDFIYTIKKNNSSYCVRMLMKKMYNIALMLVSLLTTSSLFSMEFGDEEEQAAFVRMLKDTDAAHALNTGKVNYFNVTNYVQQKAPKSLNFWERRCLSLEQGLDTIIMQLGVQLGISGLIWVVNKVMKNKSASELEKEATQQQLEANKLHLKEKKLELKERKLALVKKKLREHGIDNVEKFLAQYSNKQEFAQEAAVVV